jgi:DNA repair exonuclease SbcCD nuclease subunit
MVRFIHASDLHLGSKQFYNPVRADDFLFAFEQILTIAKESSVDFILFGGDVFDTLDILPHTLTRIIQILTAFYFETKNQILIIAIEGNHDLRKFIGPLRIGPTQSWLKFLGLLGYIIVLNADIDDIEKGEINIFKEYNWETKSGGTIRIKNAQIFGIKYSGKNTPNLFPKIQQAISKYSETDGSFNILLMHFGIQGQMKGVPGIELSLVKPLHFSVQYLALGHYHLQFQLEGWIFNPGSTEANALIESTFKRGIFLVETDDIERKIRSVKMIKLQNRPFQWITLFLPDHLLSQRDFEEFLLAALLKHLEPLDSVDMTYKRSSPIVRLTLKGMTPISKISLEIENIKRIIMDTFDVVDAYISIQTEKGSLTLDGFLEKPKIAL